MNNLKKGKEGEQIAENYLISNGYKIIAKNFRSGKSEIDIIAIHGGETVFIEVKSRESTKYGQGLEAVNKKKQNMIVQGAYAYLLQQNLFESAFRFDVIGVDLMLKKVYEHIKNAFVIEN